MNPVLLKELRDLGNTVIVVEHDEDIMKIADYIIDIGPEAGTFGGHIVAEGSFKDILKSDSLTANYLTNTLSIEIPKTRRKIRNVIELIGDSGIMTGLALAVDTFWDLLNTEEREKMMQQYYRCFWKWKKHLGEKYFISCFAEKIEWIWRKNRTVYRN